MVVDVCLKFEVEPGEDCETILQVFGDSREYFQLLQSISQEVDEFVEGGSVANREGFSASDENNHMCRASSVGGGIEFVRAILRAISIPLDGYPVPAEGNA